MQLSIFADSIITAGNFARTFQICRSCSRCCERLEIKTSLRARFRSNGNGKATLVSNGKVTALFASENLDIKKLFQDVGMKPAASGSLNVKLDAHGTLADLDARLDVQMRDLRSENLPKIEPASFDLSARAKGK